MIIKGSEMNIPSNRVYLSHSSKWNVFIDSADVVDGNFIFNLGKDVEPFMATIVYLDSEGNHVSLSIVNPYSNVGAGSSKYSFFMLENGVTNLTGTTDPRGDCCYASVGEGVENSLLLKTQNRNIGGLVTTDETSYNLSINRVKLFVKEHPDSFYLLQNIMMSKIHYRKEDLQDVFDHFNEFVKRSKYGILVREYLRRRLSLNEVTRPLSLRNDKGLFIADINKAGRLNMMVFWASWCKPCRSEIPQIKEIFKRYENNGLNLVSISLDEDEGMWRKALEYERMNWDQFIIPKDSLEIVRDQYNFNAIPLVVFTNETGKELARFSGFDVHNIDKYKEFIESELLGLSRVATNLFQQQKTLVSLMDYKIALNLNVRIANKVVGTFIWKDEKED